MEQAEGTIVIDAPLDDVVDVIEDYASYPEWAEVRRVEIRERGEGGRPTEVAFEVDVPVLGKASYTLRYRYAPGGEAISWDSIEAHGGERGARGAGEMTARAPPPGDHPDRPRRPLLCARGGGSGPACPGVP